MSEPRLKTENIFGNFIGGKWTLSTGQRLIEDVNPATKETLGYFQQSAREQAVEAIEEAQKSFGSWADTPAPQRGTILFKAAQIMESRVDHLSKTLTREEGKTLKESRAEVARAIDIFKFYGSLGFRLKGETAPSNERSTLLYTIRSPLGVISVITPWNFPLAIPSWKIAPALVAGNTVVFKPASLTPMIGMEIVKALDEAGLPKGVLNFVTGAGNTVGEELITNLVVAAITFTGSYDVGSRINATCSALRIVRTQLEMGGKNPTVVCADANLEQAVEIVTKGAFGLTGQACTATSRVIVEESIAEIFTKKLVDRARRIKVGNGLDDGIDIGPAVSESQRNTDLDYIRIGKDEGARLLLGGGVPSGPEHANGFFVEPTIFADVSPEMRIAREEIFGPVLTILEAEDFEEALAIANNSEYGLSAGICTTSLKKAHEFATRVQAGVVKINKPTTGLELHVPYGGIKRSSSQSFKEQGEQAIEFFTQTKTVYLGY